MTASPYQAETREKAGIRGWLLAVVICLTILDPMGRILEYAQWVSARRLVPVAYQPGFDAFLSIGSWMLLLEAACAVTAGVILMLSRKRWAPCITMLLIVFAWIVLPVAEGALLHLEGPFTARNPYVFEGLITSAVFCGYLHLSKRVRNTYVD